MCNDVQMSNFRRLWEDLIQYGHRLEGFLIDKLELAHTMGLSHFRQSLNFFGLK
jgi:hypothetical protein